MSAVRIAAKLLLVIICSTFEVRVRAAHLEDPKGCLSQNVECAVFSAAGHTSFKMQGAEVRLTPGSSVVKKAPDLLRVVRGNVLVKTGGTLKVETLFTQVQVTDGGILFEARDENVKMTNMSAEVRYTPRGHASDLDLPKGLMTQVGRVATNGQATTEYPRSMNLKPLVEVWSRFFKRNEYKVLQDDFEAFIPHWRAGLDFIGPWYRDTVNREIAEHKAELARLKKLREVRAREENYYREMFRRKNFLD